MLRSWSILTILVCLLATAVANAQDDDQTISNCGIYKVFGQLDCFKMEECHLSIGHGTRSVRKIKIEDVKNDISYFHNENVEMGIIVHEIKRISLASVETSPKKIISASSKSGMTLIKSKACK